MGRDRWYDPSSGTSERAAPRCDFGAVAMIVQVALTVICLPPAMGIAQEALWDRRHTGAFPGGRVSGGSDRARPRGSTDGRRRGVPAAFAGGSRRCTGISNGTSRRS